MSRFPHLVLLLSLLGCATAGSAATFTIRVGGNSNTFTPSSLTITSGDTVTWSNAGGFHNVAADDGSFRNGDASSSAWTFSRTFNSTSNKPTTIRYFCEVHGAPGGIGMAGSIVVNPAASASMPLGGYMSGNWYGGSSQSGHGFQLEFTSQNNTAVAIWFVYSPDGSAQNWIYAQGTYDPTQSTVTLPAFLLTGAKFPNPLSNFDPAAVQRTDWGTLTFSFTDCNNGTASWNSTVAGYGNGSLPITRVSQIAGTACPQ